MQCVIYVAPEVPPTFLLNRVVHLCQPRLELFLPRVAAPYDEAVDFPLEHFGQLERRQLGLGLGG